MAEIIYFVMGVVFGFVLTSTITFLVRKKSEKKEQEVEERLKGIFSNLSLDALRKFPELAKPTLDEVEKGLEGKITPLTQSLEKVQSLVNKLEKDREKKFGELSSTQTHTLCEITKLSETTAKLKESLASSKKRGDWGERMAEDILQLAGFIEGVNYEKQKTDTETGKRPDFTFPLPQNLKLYMDVKFPFDNYRKALEMTDNNQFKAYSAQFINDVKNKVKKVAQDYINPAGGTVDYALMFIPNESVYEFIHQEDSKLLDEALKQKVVLCSPLSLYAILAVIRQAVENFRMEKTAKEILNILASFRKQWEKYLEVFDKMGDKIRQTKEEYDKLQTTRKNRLDRELQKIDELKILQTGEGISLVETGGLGKETAAAQED